MWIATFLSLVVGVPLAMDKRATHLLSGLLLAKRDSANPTTWTDSKRALTFYVGWTLIILGILPFTCQSLLGIWDSARLGAWPYYFATFPYGYALMRETGSPEWYRYATAALAVMNSTISLLIAGCELAIVWVQMTQDASQGDDPPESTWRETAYQLPLNFHMSTGAVVMGAAIIFCLFA